MSRKRSLHNKQTPWHRRWFRLFVLGWMIVFSASCAQSIKERLFEKQVVDGSAQASAGRARLQKALQHLEAGKIAPARKILEQLSRQENTSHVGPASEFYLGVVKLLEMWDPHGMETCKTYFQGYIDEYPTAPYKVNAVRIVRLLERQIGRTRKLNRVIEDQAQEIRTLKYQIQKLEEIQQETDRKRQSLELQEEE